MNRIRPVRWFGINRVTCLLISLVTSLLLLSVAFIPYETADAQESSKKEQ